MDSEVFPFCPAR